MNDTTTNSLTYEFYEGFQRAEFHRWDAILAEDLLLNSPAGFGIRGLKRFKEFAVQFTNLGYRIDLVDEHLALDVEGNGRGFITFCLHWKHMKDFGGLSPTGRGLVHDPREEDRAHRRRGQLARSRDLHVGAGLAHPAQHQARTDRRWR
jgi:hypothetical protein